MALEAVATAHSLVFETGHGHARFLRIVVSIDGALQICHPLAG